MLKEYGFIRVGALVNEIHLCDPIWNVNEIIKKFKEAEEAWTKAIELDPTYFLAYAYRAGIRDEQDKFKEALEDYNKVLECNPKYYYAYENIGILALHEKDYRTAGSAFYECRKNAGNGCTAGRIGSAVLCRSRSRCRSADQRRFPGSGLRLSPRAGVDFDRGRRQRPDIADP